jgi:hypothetical protein
LIKSKIDIPEPNFENPYILKEDPMRQKLRRETAEPKLTKSRTLKLDESRNIPYTERLEPMRRYDRILIVDPNVAKSKILRELPSRVRPYTEMEEPNRTIERIDNELPM